MDSLWFVLTGFSGGVLGGMGMGGGTILIPLLSLCLNVPQHFAQAINLVSFIPMAIIAIVIHARNKLIKTEGFFTIIVCGLLFCVLGSFVAKNIKADILRRIFGGFLVILSITEAVGIFVEKRKSR